MTPPPSPHVGPGLGWGRTRATEEDETVSGSELCPETDSQGRPPGRPHAAEGAERAARAGKNVPVAFLVTSVFSWGGWGPAFWLLRTKAMMS